MKKTLSFLAAALLCVAVNAQVAFSENFNSCADGTVPTGWVTYGDNLTNHYTGFNNSWQAYEQTMICITWTEETSSAVDRWLVTPQVTVPETNPMLIFDVNGVNYGPGSPYAESLKIMVSTTDNQKASFVLLEDLGNLTAGNNTYAVDLSTYSGQQVYLAFACYTADGVYIFLDNVMVKQMPDVDISVVDVTADRYAPMGGNFNVNVTVKNNGYNNITSFYLNHNINNGTDEELAVTGINVPTLGTYTYTFSTSHPDAELVTVYVTVSNPNGVADADDSDNGGSVNLTVYDPQYVTDRNPLLEHFTTAQCQYCPPGHDRLNQAMNGFENRISWVAHHVGFGTDAMTIQASSDIIGLYGGDGTWAPAMALDRDHAFASDQVGVVGSVGDVTDLQQQFAEAIATPSIVTVNIENLTYDQNTRELSFNVNGEFLSDFAGDVANLTIYITEDSIISRQTHYQQGTINNYKHDHVVRAAITPSWGDSDPFTTTLAGSTYSKTYTYTLPTKLRANKCRVIAFVNNYGPSILKREVYNSAKTGYLMVGQDPTNVAINSVEASISVKTYPNPATEMVFVSAESTIRSFSMVNTLGQTIMSNANVNTDVLELNVADLAAGVYYIKVVTDKGTATESVTVVK